MRSPIVRSLTSGSRGRTPRTPRTLRTFRTFRASAATLACLLLAGCFTLSPIRMDGEIAPGRFRVHLSDAGAARVAGITGGGRVTSVDGRLTASTADEIVLLVPSSAPAGFRTEVLYQELRLPKDEVSALQRRRLDRMRTGLTAGGVAAVAGFLLYRSLSGETGGSQSGGPDGPTESRVPLFRLRFP